MSDSYDAFISYHSRDRGAVEALARSLAKAGLKIFLDRWYLIPGQPWPDALERVLGSCRAVVICVGPGEMGEWQKREKNYALERQASTPGFPVIPVLLPGADTASGFLAQNMWVDFRAGVEQPAQLLILVEAIRGTQPELVLTSSVCPYRGLSYFREEDAPFFFGRESAVDTLARTLEKHNFVALVGASGSGKSSVVRAGLIPKLRLDKANPLEAVTMVPGDRPLYNLAAKLTPLLEPKMTESDLLVEVGKQAKALTEGSLQIRDIVERIQQRQVEGQRFLLFVDQWEELYSLSPESEARRFMDGLLATCDSLKLDVVLTLRGDFVGRALGYRPLIDRLQDAQVLLGPMSQDELKTAIEAPARMVGSVFEPGLVDRILDDVGDEPGNLPLLEFVLQRLWEDGARHNGQMRHQAYADMGGLVGALANTADSVYAGLSDTEQQATQRLLLQLVSPGEGVADTRRRASLTELDESERRIVQRLANQRLLVTNLDGDSSVETVEVAHEALIRHWQQLRQWLNRDREFLLWRERLRGAREEWLHTDHDVSALLQGARLVEAERWLDKKKPLSDEEQGFIRLSLNARRRRNALLVSGALIAIIAADFLWWYAHEQLTPRMLWLWARTSAGFTPAQPEMVQIESGTFLMGASGADADPTEKNQHLVSVPKPFLIGKYEVSFEQYELFARATGRHLPDDNGWGGGGRPVINVSWNDAQAYAHWLSERTGLRYRLPTEAEWEYTARAGTSGAYWWGDSSAGPHAVCADCGNEWDNKSPAPVGSFPANPWGLHDTAGNVWEWVEDCWHDNYTGAPVVSDKPWVDQDKCAMRVIRGGTWSDGGWFMRSSSRLGFMDAYRTTSVGFRIARDVE